MNDLIEDVETELVLRAVPQCVECGSYRIKSYFESDTGASGLNCLDCGCEDVEWHTEEVEVEKLVLREMTDKEQKEYNEWWEEYNKDCGE